MRKTSDEVFIPNQEIAQEFLNAVDGPGWDGLVQALKRSDEILRSTWALDENTVADHSIITVNAYSYTIITAHKEKKLPYCNLGSTSVKPQKDC